MASKKLSAVVGLFPASLKSSTRSSSDSAVGSYQDFSRPLLFIDACSALLGAKRLFAPVYMFLSAPLHCARELHFAVLLLVMITATFNVHVVRPFREHLRHCLGPNAEFQCIDNSTLLTPNHYNR